MDFKNLNKLFLCNKAFIHQKYREQNMSDIECMICSYVHSNRNCSQEDIASELRIDKTTIGKAVARLEAKNYISRTQSTEDRRRKCLVLTSEGLEKIAGLLNVHNDWLNEILDCLTKEEQLRFDDYCRRLIERAEIIARSLPEDKK